MKLSEGYIETLGGKIQKIATNGKLKPNKCTIIEQKIENTTNGD